MSNADRILECLRDSFATVYMVADRIGLDETNVRKWLKRLEAEGRVESFNKEGKTWWRLCEQPATLTASMLDTVEDTIAEVSDRVSLAEELVKLERRRLEILEALK